MSRTDESLVASALTTYARALDTKRWGLLDEVFLTDVHADYAGEVICEGLDSLKEMIAAVLGPCGQTQHLLGNFETRVEGDRAQLECAVRAFHADAAAGSDRYYELFGVYRATLRRVSTGWRIAHFREDPVLERGSYDVLGAFLPTSADGER